MQQRRLRPGDVLDDYCPRERRVTDHAIVAMIEDDIKQTRCVSCDTEHEYKQAKVPVQRRKKAAPALFTQVLDGLQGPVRLAHNGGEASDEIESEPADDNAPSQPTLPRLSAHTADEPVAPPAPEPPASSQHVPTADASMPEGDGERGAEEGPVRRPLIRAQLPRHEGQQPPTRDLPDFTIRQPSTNRGNRPPGGGAGGTRPGVNRRRGGGPQQGQGGGGATRFSNQGRSNQFGRSNERRHGGRSGQGGQGQGHGQGHGSGQGQGHGHGAGRPNRGGRRGGGKKH